jgi:hypothetical protein
MASMVALSVPAGLCPDRMRGPSARVVVVNLGRDRKNSFSELSVLFYFIRIESLQVRIKSEGGRS